MCCFFVGASAFYNKWKRVAVVRNGSRVFTMPATHVLLPLLSIPLFMSITGVYHAVSRGGQFNSVTWGHLCIMCLLWLMLLISAVFSWLYICGACCLRLLNSCWWLIVLNWGYIYACAAMSVVYCRQLLICCSERCVWNVLRLYSYSYYACYLYDACVYYGVASVPEWCLLLLLRGFRGRLCAMVL